MLLIMGGCGSVKKEAMLICLVQPNSAVGMVIEEREGLSTIDSFGNRIHDTQ
jgi:hypothetical protein